MSLNRPRRKATINKSYNDTLDESVFEEIDAKPALLRNSTTLTAPRRKTSSANSLKRASVTDLLAKDKKLLPYNWQPVPVGPDDYFSFHLDLDDAYVDPSNHVLYCPNQSTVRPKQRGTKEVFLLRKGDFLYMVCEPPGEPYYIGRIMGFKRKHRDHGQNQDQDQLTQQQTHSNSQSLSQNLSRSQSQYRPAGEYVFQIQWFYRPRDISKSTSDSRLLYASMHTDTCPLQSFRGLVTVKHKQQVEQEYSQTLLPTVLAPSGPKNSKKSGNSPSNITPLEAYSQDPNCFYFDKLFDRYMIKFYDIIPTALLLPYLDNQSNNSRNFITALHKRFEFVFMEAQRTKAFMSSFASTESCHCEECGQWCSPADSVNCASCHKYFHMLCLNPPLMKKPSRGFSWSCAPCNKKHEMEYQSKRLLMLSNDNKSSNEKELEAATVDGPESETEIEGAVSSVLAGTLSSATDTALSTTLASATDTDSAERVLPKYEIVASQFLRKDSTHTLEQRRLLEEWNMRYLGMHSRLEDGVDIDDRSPYPRASTRLGPKHQATNIPEYENHPIVYYDTEQSTSSSARKKPSKKKKVDEDQEMVKLPLPKQFVDVPLKDFPQWLQPRPKGYIERGVDDGEGITATLLWKPTGTETVLDEYVQKCAPIAEKLNLLPTSPNFMDAILSRFHTYGGDSEKAYQESCKLTRAVLKEPTFSKQEVERFEAGVRKYGSELYPTFKEVRTQPCAMVVRFYYLWKKTPNGRLIWGNFGGRQHKKLQNVSTVKADDKKGQVDDKEGPEVNVNKESQVDPLQNFSAAQKTSIEVSVGTNVEAKAKGVHMLVDPNDDSAYEPSRIAAASKIFGCKHCHTIESTQWFRVTGYDPKTKLDVSKEDKDFAECDAIGLCLRCARLWRRYAVVWEDPVEVQKKSSKSVGGWKKKTEAELVVDSERILNQAELEGAILTYEQIEINGGFITEQRKKVPPTPGKRQNPSPTPSKKQNPSPAPNKKPKVEPVKKPMVKEEVNPPKRKRLAPAPKESVKVQIKTESKKVTAKTTSDSKPKRRRGETSILAKSQNEARVKSEDINDIDAPAIKKSRSDVNGKASKTSDLLINPIFNTDYITPKSEIQLDKKNLPSNGRDALRKILSCHRIKQLADLHPQVQPYQLPNQTRLKLHFDTDERNCSICLDYDPSESSGQEMLICSNCGVNVHASCSRISVPPNAPLPIKEWLCRACINDLNPYHTTLYSCCLCLANDSNHELSMFGSPLVKPDYLIPINDSGKWCHLLCALFNHSQVTFRHSSPVSPQRKLTREELNDQKFIIESTHNTLSIESVSEAYLRNYTSRCGICHSLNGSLVPCDLCEDSQKKYHVICAQDTANFKLGFRLVPQKATSKENYNVTIGNESGRLKPVILCPKHDHSRSGIHSMRALGRRSKDELKPLILLFIDDIIKSATTTTTRLSGPQFKAHNYIHMIKIFAEEEAARKIKFSNLPSDTLKESEKFCIRCNTRASPMWWINQKQDSAYNFLCQSCYHRGDDEEPQPETRKLREILHEPLEGLNYGLGGENDRLSDVYNIPLTPPPKVETVRSRMAIGDILS